MGGFSAQVQPSQSSAPAGKGAGMSSMQMGMNPIEESPEKQMMKMQQLQMEQPNFSEANQIQPNIQNGTQMGGLGGALGGLMGGKVTMPGQGGQPQIGMPNAYSNTMQPWDNQSNQQGRPSGKGMGASGASGKGA
jgi:hypothetical protein